MQVGKYFPDPLLVSVLAIHFRLSLAGNFLPQFGMLQVEFYQI